MSGGENPTYFYNKKFFYALATLIGMIIGVGIFGIPYCFSQAGFAIGFFYLILLTGAVLLLHLFYGEIILRTNHENRLVGYAEKYLGSKGKNFAGAIIIFEFYGALLAYLIAGGHFLNIILGRFFGGSDFLWTMIFFAFGSLLILFGLKTVAASEFFMAILLLLAAFVFIFKGLPLINIANLKTLDWAKFFLPYGVVLFSLTGGAAIPEIRQILKGQEGKIKKVIVLGTLIPALIYALFALSIASVMGSGTTENAIDGLAGYFGQWVLVLGAIFGFLAVITSFLVLGLNLRRVFQYDYKQKAIFAWVLACFVPLVGYLLGLNDFIVVIGLIGALAGGLEGIMTILIYRKAKKTGDRQPEYSLKIAKPIILSLIFIFALGIVYELINYFAR